jgi:hypothetical protein
MESQAEQMAFLVVGLGLQPSEVTNLTQYELEALIQAGKDAGKFK